MPPHFAARSDHRAVELVLRGQHQHIIGAKAHRSSAKGKAPSEAQAQKYRSDFLQDLPECPDVGLLQARLEQIADSLADQYPERLEAARRTPHEVKLADLLALAAAAGHQEGKQLRSIILAAQEKVWP